MTAVTGTASSTTGTASWTNPSNIFTSNNVYAVTSSTVANVSLSGFIYALGHGFSIPTTATIDGLEVSIEAKNQLSGTGFRCRHNGSDIFLRYSGADQSANSPSGVGTATWVGISDTTQTLGSSSASWGASLTPAIINDSSFGVRVRFQNLNATAQTFSVDLIAITIYYTDGGVSSSQQFFSRRF